MQSVDEEPKLSIPFDFRKYLFFFAEIYYFLQKTRLLSNLTRTPCSSMESVIRDIFNGVNILLK